MDPNSAIFLLGESRNTPMHVGLLQLFEPPSDAGPDFARSLFERGIAVEEVAPLFTKRPVRSASSAGQWSWVKDTDLDIEHHVRLGAVPRPGRIRDLLELVGRLHGQRLSLERPLWETTIIDGIDDGRIAIYSKIHHALIDGVSGSRLVQSVLSTDPDERGMSAAWAARTNSTTGQPKQATSLRDVPLDAVRTALGLSAEAAGMPAALLRTLARAGRRETSTIAFGAPRTIFNTEITGARRVAADDWPVDRLKAVGKATDATINDVVLAMCSGALRSYLLEQNALPDRSLIAMVPVGLNAKQSHLPSGSGGNAVGSLMVRLGTELSDPQDRLAHIHESMRQGKDALSSMTPMQIVAMSGLGVAPTVLLPMLGVKGSFPPPFNLTISNVPGPRETLYLEGAKLTGAYPLSIPMHGVAMNITCASYAGNMGFGLVGCRRSVPHLQRLLGHLETSLTDLEMAAGL